MYTQNCDKVCTGCSMNNNGWCVWKDIPIYRSAMDEIKERLELGENNTRRKYYTSNFTDISSPCFNCHNNPKNNPSISGICSCNLLDLWRDNPANFRNINNTVSSNKITEELLLDPSLRTKIEDSL